MKIPFVDLHKQYLSIKSEIDSSIADVIAESAFLRGPHVTKFERKFSTLIGVENCISCGNGTDALYIAMKSLGVKSGDEVITTSHSWISTSETITQTGAKVVFCDTKKNDFTINPEVIESKINTSTKGIIPVHLFGQACDMDSIMAIASKYNLWIIEDCAQAHFAKYKGRYVGTFGDIATFSFYPGKNLGAMGDAGCLVTDNKKLSKFATLFARHGGKGNHLIEGINSRMDGLQAAVLNVKLKYILEWTKKRQTAAAIYNNRLKTCGELQIPYASCENEHVYHLYVIKAKERDKLMAFLQKHDIATSINYPKALPFLKAYEYLNSKAEEFPVTYKHQSEILSLPIFPEIKKRQIEYICEKILDFYR